MHARILAFSMFLAVSSAGAQEPPGTPLRPEILTLLANEVSGQRAYNNLVRLAGAPWLREPTEFASTFHESRELHALVRSYGITTVRLDQFPREGTFPYPTAGELWLVEPGPRLVARLGADAALVASGSRSADITAELVYLPPLSAQELRALPDGRATYAGKVALMWSHPRGEVASALDELGIQAVIAFNTRDRYGDPNQVVYSGGGYADGDQLRLGMSVSWRQWSELLEDVERGERVTVRLQAQVEQYPDRFEWVVAWILGTEPDAPGILFTGHLYEGYLKRGANDNAGGPAVQLEILRTLHHLIEAGEIPRPRRTITFLWPNEISGTYEFIRRNPGLADRLSININMDMVSEGLRRNNGVFTMSETPAHLPSYLDGLTKSILNYVWRTNDIVYLPDSPRGRPGGQYFPRPMVEKNGSVDAFRFFVHEATGGSDHICFNNPAVGVPAIELFTWPDQWYHADTDLPDKADPTEMKRVGFIGTAAALVAADLTDERLAGLMEEVSAFGYARVAERAVPQALGRITRAPAPELDASLRGSLTRIDAAVAREIEALESIRAIYTGTERARTMVDDRIAQWEGYRDALRTHVVEYAGRRAQSLGRPAPGPSEPTAEEQRYALVVPALHPEVRGTEFSLNASSRYRAYMEAHPAAFADLGLSSAQTRQILNFVNGRRSIAEISSRVTTATDEDLDMTRVARYLSVLEAAGWVVMRD